MFHYFSSTTLGFYCRRNFLCYSRGGVKRLSRPWGKRPHGNGGWTHMGRLAPCVLFMADFVFSIAWHPVTSISPFCIIYLLRYLKSSKAIQLSGKRRCFQCKMSADVRSWLWWGTCRGRSRWPFVEGVCWSEYSKLGPNPIKNTILCDYPISQPVASCPTRWGVLPWGWGKTPDLQASAETLTTKKRD